MHEFVDITMRLVGLPHHRFCISLQTSWGVASLVGAEICWKCVSKRHRYELKALNLRCGCVFEALEQGGKQR
jgi:hypothetical protein